MAVWERYKPLLENDYSRSGYLMSVDANTYSYMKVSVLHIYVNYHVTFLQFIILKKSNFVLYTYRITTPLKITRQWFE